jgi:hypothetical protein
MPRRIAMSHGHVQDCASCVRREGHERKPHQISDETAVPFNLPRPPSPTTLPCGQVQSDTLEKVAGRQGPPRSRSESQSQTVPRASRNYRLTGASDTCVCSKQLCDHRHQLRLHRNRDRMPTVTTWQPQLFVTDRARIASTRTPREAAALHRYSRTAPPATLSWQAAPCSHLGASTR